MSQDSKLRLFAAVELPEEWRVVLGRLRPELEKVAPGELKWVRPELMHLTLVFLGYQQPAAIPIITAASTAAAAGTAPFTLSLGDVGCFGQPHSVHVIWVGLGSTPVGLQRLHEALVEQLSARGVSFDRRPLVPHVTLARARRPIDRAASLRLHSTLERTRIPRMDPRGIREYVLMQSHLSRLGPDYQVADRFRLGDVEG